MQGGELYWRRIQEIGDKYVTLLIIDEVMSGFGRTGRWFDLDHYPSVRPSIMVMAKGLTSGYIPIVATIVKDEIAAQFKDSRLWAGLTYSAHPVA